jgi:hypothetical protein
VNARVLRWGAVLVHRLSAPGAYVIGLVQALLLLALEWLLLGVLFEGLIGRFLRGFSWQEIAARYHPTTETWDSLIVAASFVLVPLLVGLDVLGRLGRSGSGLGPEHPI